MNNHQDNPHAIVPYEENPIWGQAKSIAESLYRNQSPENLNIAISTLEAVAILDSSGNIPAVIYFLKTLARYAHGSGESTQSQQAEQTTLGDVSTFSTGASTDDRVASEYIAESTYTPIFNKLLQIVNSNMNVPAKNQAFRDQLISAPFLADADIETLQKGAIEKVFEDGSSFVVLCYDMKSQNTIKYLFEKDGVTRISSNSVTLVILDHSSESLEDQYSPYSEYMTGNTQDGEQFKNALMFLKPVFIEYLGAGSQRIAIKMGFKKAQMNELPSSVRNNLTYDEETKLHLVVLKLDKAVNNTKLQTALSNFHVLNVLGKPYASILNTITKYLPVYEEVPLGDQYPALLVQELARNEPLSVEHINQQTRINLAILEIAAVFTGITLDTKTGRLIFPQNNQTLAGEVFHTSDGGIKTVDLSATIKMIGDTIPQLSKVDPDAVAYLLNHFLNKNLKLVEETIQSDLNVLQGSQEDQANTKQKLIDLLRTLYENYNRLVRILADNPTIQQLRDSENDVDNWQPTEPPKLFYMDIKTRNYKFKDVLSVIHPNLTAIWDALVQSYSV